LLTDLAIDYEIINGRIVLPATFQIESDDLGFAISIRNPLPLTFYPSPVMMPQPSMPTFDYDPTINFPTGAQEGDEQPVNQQDTSPIDGAQDPATMVVFNNSTLVCWSETRSQMTREFGNPVATWFAIEPGALPSGHKIQMFAWNRSEDGGTGGYLIAHNDTIASPDTRVYYRRNVGSMEEWSESVLTDMLATMVNVTAKAAVIVYGKFEQFISGAWIINFLAVGIDGGGNNNGISGDQGGISLEPSDSAGNPHTDPVSQSPGVYDEPNDRFFGESGDDGGKACDISWDVPPGVTITEAKSHNVMRRGTGSGGEKRFGISIDGVRVASGNWGVTPNEQIAVLRAAGGPWPDPSRIIFHNSKDNGSGDGYVRIEGVRIEGGGLEDFVGTRFSTDRGEAFESAKSVGLMDLGDGSFTRRKGGAVLAAKSENVKRAPLAGEAFLFNADQGSGVGAGRFATALLKFGSGDDYLIAPDGGAVGLYKVVNDVLTDITPNDGANNGFAVGPGALAMTSIDDDFIWFLGNFGGSVKLAYSTDLGTSWNFNGDPTSNATWVTANPRSSKMIYISDGSNILQSLDGGATLTSHTSPISNLTGVAAL